jgi:hypothetical protein
MKKLLISMVVSGILTAPVLAQAEVAVIVHKDSSVSLNNGDIANIFLGKDKSLKAVDQKEWTDNKTLFYSKVANKNSTQLKSYWSSLVFTGKGQPPTALDSDADVIKQVAADVNAIGYIDAAQVNDSVKVLSTFKD